MSYDSLRKDYVLYEGNIGLGYKVFLAVALVRNFMGSVVVL